MKNSIFWLILVVLLFPDIGYSCKCNLEKVEQYSKAPITAPVVILGKLVKSTEKHYLKLIKTWTAALDETRLETGTDCSFTGLTMGTNYLLLSDKSTNSLYADLVGECSSVLVELTPQNVSLINQLADKKDFTGEINPSWQFCMLDNECAQSKNQCGNLVGVNKKYQKDYINFLKTKKTKVDCSKVSTQKEKYQPSKCKENFCS